MPCSESRSSSTSRISPGVKDAKRMLGFEKSKFITREDHHKSCEGPMRLSFEGTFRNDS